MCAMRIAIVRQRYTPYGGAERFVARAIEALQREGVGVTVLARSWQEGGREAGPLELLRCDPFYLGRVWRDRSFARSVCATLALRRFDLVQSHERIACCDVYRAGDGVHDSWPVVRRSRGRSPFFDPHGQICRSGRSRPRVRRQPRFIAQPAGCAQRQAQPTPAR